MAGIKKVLVSMSVLILILCLYTVHVYAEESSIGAGTITGSVVNLREEPNTSSKVLDKLPKGTVVNVLSASGEWYNVVYGDKTGWVYGKYLSINEKTLGIAIVTTEVLNVRSKPDLSSDVITQIYKGNKFAVTAVSENWYKLKTTDGTEAWASSDYMEMTTSSVSRGSDIERDVKLLDVSTSKAQKIIDFAKKFLGVKYVYGGTTPKGFDCSGFVQYVFKNSGITLSRTAASQAKHGTKVSKSDLVAGDLVFFSCNGGGIDHVGIYIGNGKFIHAESYRKGVTITELSDSYYARAYKTARRVL